MQGTLQRFPDKGLRQQLLRFKNQIATIGPVQGTGTQLPVTGVEHALVRAVLDATKQVVIGRMRLEHHGSTTVVTMANYSVGTILLLQQFTPDTVTVLLINQLLNHSFQQVALHRLQIGLHARVVAVLGSQQRHAGLQCQADGFLVQAAQLIARLALPQRQTGQLGIQLFFQPGNIGMKLFTLGFRALCKLGLVQCPTLEHGRKGNIGAVPVQGNIFFQCQLFDPVQHLVVLLVETSINGTFFLLPAGCFEHRRKGRQDGIQQPGNITTELATHTGRQLNRVRFARFVEVIDIQPVGRRRGLLRHLVQMTLYIRKAARPRLAHDKDVIAGTRHCHAELQCFHGPCLPQHTGERFQFIGPLKRKHFFGQQARQAGSRQAQLLQLGVRHGESL